MTNPLESLARREAELLAKLPVHGHFEERWPEIEAAGLPAQWSQIIDEYAGLLGDPDAGVEALRRGVFLLWLSWIEPPALTGIRDISPATESTILRRLEDELRAPEPDLQLRSMLSGYGPGLPFDQHPDHTATAAFLASATGRRDPDVALPSLGTRGAMGAYWLSRNL